jgi:hypothetical protein
MKTLDQTIPFDYSYPTSNRRNTPTEGLHCMVCLVSAANKRIEQTIRSIP